MYMLNMQKKTMVLSIRENVLRNARVKHETASLLTSRINLLVFNIRNKSCVIKEK